jgi:predicted MFS family arabinose efflux permease
MAPVAIAFNSSAIYTGQAIGTIAGGVYYTHATHLLLPWVAAGFVCMALWLSKQTFKTRGV